MQQISPSPSSLVENLKILPTSTSTSLSETSAPSNDTHYSSLLLKKKLAMLDSASKMTSPAEMSDPNDAPVSVSVFHFVARWMGFFQLIKPSSTTLSINENEPVKSASRVRRREKSKRIKITDMSVFIASKTSAPLVLVCPCRATQCGECSRGERIRANASLYLSRIMTWVRRSNRSAIQKKRIIIIIQR